MEYALFLLVYLSGVLTVLICQHWFSEKKKCPTENYDTGENFGSRDALNISVNEPESSPQQSIEFSTLVDQVIEYWTTPGSHPNMGRDFDAYDKLKDFICKNLHGTTLVFYDAILDSPRNRKIYFDKCNLGEVPTLIDQVQNKDGVVYLGEL